MSSMSKKQRELRQQLKDNYQFYAPKALKIRTKDGSVTPFSFNLAQKYLHERLEAQLEEQGFVRALVLKGRQMGISTYIGGRFYHKCTHRKGTYVFILTHEQGATDNLFGMVDRYHENCPSSVKPQTGAANAKELSFDKLDSGYKVGTAGTKAVGRSQTIQLFHGSEVAFWPEAGTHFSGVIQAVPDLPGTEIILESTANGVGGEFYERWQNAEAGISDYIAIFIPWFWMPEYTREVPEDFDLTEEEEKYYTAYKTSGCTLGHMVWRRAKTSELGAEGDILFKQEYPATAAEAFQTTGHDAYIDPELVLKARKNTVENPIGSLVMGADPCRFGDDRFVIARRRTRKVFNIESRTKMSVVEGAAWCKRVIDDEKPKKFFIDVGGVGAGVYDLLVDWGYGDVVVAVDFGSKPIADVEFDDHGRPLPGPKNRRAEIWRGTKLWLQDPAGVDIPDKDSLQADACAPGYSYDSKQQLVIESKEKIRSRGMRSPDEWDAVALTFAEPVGSDLPGSKEPNLTPRMGNPLSGMLTGMQNATGWMGS